MTADRGHRRFLILVSAVSYAWPLVIFLTGGIDSPWFPVLMVCRP